MAGHRLGKYIKINGVYFQVVGVQQNQGQRRNGRGPDAKIYVPFTTFQKAFNAVNEVHWFTITAQARCRAWLEVEKQMRNADGPQATACIRTTRSPSAVGTCRRCST